MQVEISIDDIQLNAHLNDTPTAKTIMNAMPLEGHANVWGEEIYFSIPVDIELEPDAIAEVPVGALAYWPTGSALCIFFGPTPVSIDEKPRAYSPVNVFGQVQGDTTVLKEAVDGAVVRISKIESVKVEELKS